MAKRRMLFGSLVLCLVVFAIILFRWQLYVYPRSRIALTEIWRLTNSSVTAVAGSWEAIQILRAHSWKTADQVIKSSTEDRVIFKATTDSWKAAEGQVTLKAATDSLKTAEDGYATMSKTVTDSWKTTEDGLATMSKAVTENWNTMATQQWVLSNAPTDNWKTVVTEDQVMVSEEKTAPPLLPARNPGCDTHQLSDFKPVLNGYTYQHPDVVHYVWSNRSPKSEFRMSFTQYVSVLSVHTFFRPTEIIVHTDAEPVGEFWTKLKKKTNIRTEVVNISRKIGTKPAAGVEHAADYYKLKHILLKHGGIVMDFDIVILNGTRLREMQRASECYLGCEQYCTLLNIGFVSCIKNSTFVMQWVNGYETDYRSKDWHVWLYNSGVYPAELLTRKKHCFNHWIDPDIAQHPDMWTKGDWLVPNRVNWKSKSVAHHFLATLVKIDPHVADEDYYRTSNTPLAQMLRYVLHSSLN